MGKLNLFFSVLLMSCSFKELPYNEEISLLVATVEEKELALVSWGREGILFSDADDSEFLKSWFNRNGVPFLTSGFEYDSDRTGPGELTVFTLGNGKLSRYTYREVSLLIVENADIISMEKLAEQEHDLKSDYLIFLGDLPQSGLPVSFLYAVSPDELFFPEKEQSVKELELIEFALSRLGADVVFTSRGDIKRISSGDRWRKP